MAETVAARAILLHQRQTSTSCYAELAELEALVLSAGASIINTLIVTRARPNAAIYIGSGKAVEIAKQVDAEKIDLLIINHQIAPIQERNLERIVRCRVIDRTGLILDIFAQRARSHEGRLQVELAQLRHLSTRLVRGWSHLERQKGGIGLRGPGETQLETDRRLLGKRIRHLHARLAKVASQRGIQRRARQKVPIRSVALVGYTNAGKTALFNHLTGGSQVTQNRLFSTLDTTIQRLELANLRSVVLSDTVGFIRELPHTLISAFKSSLEEVCNAHLLLHVVDISNEEASNHMTEVTTVLREIGAENVEKIVVFNKIDLTGQKATSQSDRQGMKKRVWLSVKTGAGIDTLLAAISQHLQANMVERSIALPPEAGKLRARLYQEEMVVDESITQNGSFNLRLQLDSGMTNWLEEQEDFEQRYWQSCEVEVG